MKKLLIAVSVGLVVSGTVFAQDEVKKAQKVTQSEVKQMKKEVKKADGNTKVNDAKDAKSISTEVKKETKTVVPAGR